MGVGGVEWLAVSPSYAVYTQAVQEVLEVVHHVGFDVVEGDSHVTHRRHALVSIEHRATRRQRYGVERWLMAMMLCAL